MAGGLPGVTLTSAELQVSESNRIQVVEIQHQLMWKTEINLTQLSTLYLENKRMKKCSIIFYCRAAQRLTQAHSSALA